MNQSFIVTLYIMFREIKIQTILAFTTPGDAYVLAYKWNHLVEAFNRYFSKNEIDPFCKLLYNKQQQSCIDSEMPKHSKQEFPISKSFENFAFSFYRVQANKILKFEFSAATCQATNVSCIRRIFKIGFRPVKKFSTHG